MTTAPQCAHPLKGIVCTNDDLGSCAVCLDFFAHRRRGGCLQHCCGTIVCRKCMLNGESPTGGLVPCVLCGGNRTSIKALKKHAKKGSAWAQFALGAKYEFGSSLRLSHEDARLWYTKAARQNHPDALHNLGCLYKDGVVGGRVDLEKARDLILSAMEIDPESSKTYAESLVAIASCYLYDGVVEKREGIKQALGILVPLTGMDPENTDATIQARFQLAYALYGKGDSQASYGWYCSAVLLAASSPGENTMGSLGESLSATSTYNAMICCGYGRLASSVTAQRIFWARLAQKECVSVKLNTDKRLERAQKIVGILRTARRLRDFCGGCGAEFEGKERKFCHGCKAFCYCSRDCQKMHWNRKKDGHREDCKGVMELKRKMKEARKQSKAS